MSSLRLGCDLCQIAAIEQMLKEDLGAAERLFNAEERSYAMTQAEPAQHLAGIFAAKEALGKAVREPGLLGKYHKEVTVDHREGGAPYLRLSEPLIRALAGAGIQIIDCSISHDGEYAMAAVLVEWVDHQRPEQKGEPASQSSRGSAEETADGVRCHRCLLTLDYLREQHITEVLIKAEGVGGTTLYLCPVCMKGW